MKQFIPARNGKRDGQLGFGREVSLAHAEGLEPPDLAHARSSDLGERVPARRGETTTILRARHSLHEVGCPAPAAGEHAQLQTAASVSSGGPRRPRRVGGETPVPAFRPVNPRSCLLP
jgi:hypothetical protein